ncbi:MAG: ABC transporter ATP-binding protein [Actinomycetes bacterium]
MTKRYGTLTANDAVTVEFNAGQVHAILGENGAGKTTLMRMAYGLERPDEGWFEVEGERVELTSPRAAMEHGIGMVHQHFMLVPTMTVAENIVIGSEPSGPWGPYRRRRVEAAVEAFAEERGLPIDASRIVGELSVGEQQRVEILRTLYRGARTVILDEPTAVLTAQEIDRLFEVLHGLCTQQGTSVVLITHKMREIMAAADHVTVLRHGKVVGSLPRAEATPDDLVSMMVGRAVNLERVKDPVPAAQPQLEVEGLVVEDARGTRAVDGVSLTVGAGEIVGIAGVDGNGQAELVGALSGMLSPAAGVIRVTGKRLAPGVRSALAAGVRYIAEDRHRRGLLLSFSVAENLALRRYREAPIARGGWMSPRRIADFGRGLLERFDIRGPSLDTPASTLSGGNQQKIVIARELEANPAVLLAAQPTRGLDIGAIAFVHEQLLELQRQGAAVLLVSFELDELRALSDRILVMYGGRIVGEFRPDASDEELGLAMAGVQEER